MTGSGMFKTMKNREENCRSILLVHFLQQVEGRPAWEAALQESPPGPLPVSGPFLAVCPLVQIEGRQYYFLEGGTLWRLGACSRGLGHWEVLLRAGERGPGATHSFTEQG